MKDSYIMIIKEGAEWRLRYGIQMDNEWQPLEWTGEDLSYGIGMITDAAFRFAEHESFTSDMNSMPTFDSLEKRTTIATCNSMLDNWGLVIFHIDDSDHHKSLWVALCGYKEQLMDKEWASAEANQDLHIAVGGLDPVKAGTAVVWRKDMIHRLNPRDDDGNITKYDQQERDRRKPIERARNKKWTDIYKSWDGAKKWTNHLNSQKGLPKSP